MSKHFNKQFRCRDIVLNRIARLIEITKNDKLSHYEFLEKRKQLVFNDPYWKDLTSWNRHYCNGYLDALYEQMMKENIVWLHYWTTKKGNTCYAKRWTSIPEHLREPANNGEPKFKSDHFWKNSEKKW